MTNGTGCCRAQIILELDQPDTPDAEGRSGGSARARHRSAITLCDRRRDLTIISKLPGRPVAGVVAAVGPERGLAVPASPVCGSRSRAGRGPDRVPGVPIV